MSPRQSPIIAASTRVARDVTQLTMLEEARVDPTEDKDRRYTTPETMDLCMRLAGVDGWDLDVAADAESHWAETWYGVEVDGLRQPWFPEGLPKRWRIWCNPPFSEIKPWVEKAWRTCGALKHDVELTIAMLLPANRTEQEWFQSEVERWRDGRSEYPFTVHFLPSRIRYGHPGNPKGHGVGCPPFGSMLLVWRSLVSCDSPSRDSQDVTHVP